MFFILPCRLRSRCATVLMVLAALLGVAGCVAPAPSSGETPAVNAQPAATATPAQAINANMIFELLKQAETATSPQRETLLLQASAYYQQMGDYVRMGRVFEELRPDTLTPPQRVEYSLQYGDWALNQRLVDDAARVLLDPSIHQGLSDAQTTVLHSLRARLFERQGRMLDALNERIAQSVHTPETGQAELSGNIWRLLVPLTMTDLQFLENADSRNPTEDQLLAGWLALAHIQRQDAGNPGRLAEDVQRWRARYTAHPAHRHMPSELVVSNAIAADSARLQRIALLLPLTGKWAAAGQAFRDGFMSMHYQQMSVGSTEPQVDLVDSSASPDILNAYQHAVAQGAQLVIGPLEKEQVQVLANQASLPVPTLALNSSAQEQRTADNLYQFSLNPDDDVAQVATAAAANGFRRALVITPQGERGDRMAQAFVRPWQQASGTATQLRYTAGTGNYSAAIADALGIDLASGQMRAGSTLPDMVYFSGNDRDVAAVMDALARNGGKAIPVYATAEVLGSHLDARTNGLRLCVSPWQVNTGTLHDAKINVPNNANARLFAMGADTEMLFSQLAPLAGNASLRLAGNTGYLSMSGQRRVVRGLVWAVMQDGQPLAQPASVDGRF